MTNTSETSLRDELIERLLAVVEAEDTAEHRDETGKVADELLPVFAAEVRRIADEFELHRRFARDSGNPNRGAGVGDCIASLRARADELGGGGR